MIIHIGICDIKRTHFGMLYHVLDNETNQDIAKALTTITFFDRQKEKVAKIPQKFLESLLQNTIV